MSGSAHAWLCMVRVYRLGLLACRGHMHACAHANMHAAIPLGPWRCGQARGASHTCAILGQHPLLRRSAWTPHRARCCTEGLSYQQGRNPYPTLSTLQLFHLYPEAALTLALNPPP